MTIYRINRHAPLARVARATMPYLRFPAIALVAAVVAMSVALTISDPTRGEQPIPAKPSSGFVYTAGEKGNSLSVIDLSTGRIETVAIPITPHNVQISSDRRLLYVIGSSAKRGESHGHGSARGRLIVFDSASIARGPLADIEVGSHPAHVIVDDKGTYAFVTNGGDNSVSVVDLAQSRVVREIKTGRYPRGLRMSPNGQEIYVANVNDGSISVISTADLAHVATIAVGKEPIQVAFTADGRWVYASLRQENSVAVIDAAARHVVTKVHVGRGPIQVFATPDSRYVLVANHGGATPDKTVSIVDVATNRIVKTIVSGKGAHGVVVSDDGRWAFVSNILDNSVSVIDIKRLVVVAKFAVGGGPNGITFKSAVRSPRT